MPLSTPSSLGLIASAQAEQAPPLKVAQWFNAAPDLSLEQLRGRIVVLHAFQMLCPGCVSHALPQAQALQRQFDAQGVVTVGLHSVFEHHAAMAPQALAAFLHEYRIDFPVAVDAPVAGSHSPATLQRYGMRGTPTLVLIDQQGRRRLQHFGRIDDLALGASLGRLLAERASAGATTLEKIDTAREPQACSDEACAI